MTNIYWQVSYYLFHFSTQQVDHPAFDVVVRHIDQENHRWRIWECIVLEKARISKIKIILINEQIPCNILL